MLLLVTLPVPVIPFKFKSEDCVSRSTDKLALVLQPSREYCLTLHAWCGSEPLTIALVAGTPSCSNGIHVCMHDTNCFVIRVVLSADSPAVRARLLADQYCIRGQFSFTSGGSPFSRHFGPVITNNEKFDAFNTEFHGTLPHTTSIPPSGPAMYSSHPSMAMPHEHPDLMAFVGLCVFCTRAHKAANPAGLAHKDWPSVKWRAGYDGVSTVTLGKSKFQIIASLESPQAEGTNDARAHHHHRTKRPRADSAGVVLDAAASLGPGRVRGGSLREVSSPSAAAALRPSGDRPSAFRHSARRGGHAPHTRRGDDGDVSALDRIGATAAAGHSDGPPARPHRAARARALATITCFAGGDKPSGHASSESSESDDSEVEVTHMHGDWPTTHGVLPPDTPSAHPSTHPSAHPPTEPPPLIAMVPQPPPHSPPAHTVAAEDPAMPITSSTTVWPVPPTQAHPEPSSTAMFPGFPLAPDSTQLAQAVQAMASANTALGAAAASVSAASVPPGMPLAFCMPMFVMMPPAWAGTQAAVDGMWGALSGAMSAAGMTAVSMTAAPLAPATASLGLPTFSSSLPTFNSGLPALSSGLPPPSRPVGPRRVYGVGLSANANAGDSTDTD